MSDQILPRERAFPDSLHPAPIEIPTDRDVTWDDIVVAGRSGHQWLWALVKMVETGRISKEQALLRTVLCMAEGHRSLMKAHVDLIMITPRPIYITEPLIPNTR